MLFGIRARLLGLVAATVLPFMALIGAGLWGQWQSDQEQALRTALGHAQVAAAHVDDVLGNFENLLIGLSEALSVDAADAAANDATLRRAKSQLPTYVSNLLIFSVDGFPIGSSSTAAERTFYAGDRDYFVQVKNGKSFAIGDPIRSRITNEWIAVAARPVKRKDGNLGAILVLSFSLEKFQEGIRTGDADPGSVIQVVNENGIVITRNADAAEWVGRNLSDGDRIVRHQAAKEVSEIARWADGTERITGSATASTIPWLVSVGLPKEVTLSKLSSRLSWGAALSSLATLIALCLAWILSGRITWPLRQLSQDVGTIAAGDLAHRSLVRASGEIGILAVAFNKMASALDERHRDLSEARELASNEAAKRAQLEAGERRAKETLAAVIDTSPVAIVCSDLERRIILWNRAAEHIFGFTAEETLGHRSPLIPPDGVEDSQRLFERAISGEVIRDVQVVRKHKQGQLIDIELAAAPIYNSDGTLWSIAWAYDDITERKAAERQLEQLAHFDQLTGIHNRAALQKDLGDLLSECRAASVALFDLDGFKEVNDTFGHASGDKLLTEAASRISRITGNSGSVYRLGGDEFVVVVPNCGDPCVSSEIVSVVLAGLAEPFVIDGKALSLGASAGISIAPHHGTDVDELLSSADFALYVAKEQRGTYRIFQPSLRVQAQAEHDLGEDLKRAFEQNEFELFFQPQIQLEDGALAGAEALLRWRHPTHGIIGPGAFVDTLADSAIAPDVGNWILRDACEKASGWRSAGLPLERVSVNLFPCQFRDVALPEKVHALLMKTGLPASALELEITENIALNHESAIAPLQALHDSGVRLAFDDFGTGYASLSYLTRFPISRIKIDRSFVAKIADEADDAAIVRSLIAMAHALEVEITAEGVETIEQEDFLRREKCEEVQGFLYAKPMSASAFEEYLLSANPQSRGAGRAYVSGTISKRA